MNRGIDVAQLEALLEKALTALRAEKKRGENLSPSGETSAVLDDLLVETFHAYDGNDLGRLLQEHHPELWEELQLM